MLVAASPEFSCGVNMKSIATKLAVWSITGVTLVLLLANWLITSHLGHSLEVNATAQIDQAAQDTVDMIDAYDKAVMNSADISARFYAQLFPGKFSLHSAEQVDVGGRKVPTIRSGNTVINLNYEQVDTFSQTVGDNANATVFVKVDDDFVRVTTSVKKQNGDRAIGTTLDRASPAYPRVKAGESFTGKVTLFGKDFITNYTPIKNDQGEVIGILYIGLDFSSSLAAMKKRLAGLKPARDGIMFVVDAAPGKNQGNLLVHPDGEGKNVLEHPHIKKMLEMKDGTLSYTVDGKDRVAAFHNLQNWRWLVVAEVDKEKLAEASRNTRILMLGMNIGVIIVMWLILFFMTRTLVAKPLAQVGELAEHIAQGDYRSALPPPRSDEIGRLIVAVGAMQQQVRKAIQEIIQHARTVAQEAQQLAGNADQLTKGSQEQSDAASSMASVVEQLTVSISQVADSATQAHRLSESSGKLSEEGGRVIHQAADEMQGISDTVRRTAEDIQNLGRQSEQITSIIKVIKDIADQTNLLALNAAIEAARAGEQGRGFAVVADEVRKLAERTTQSTQEIGAMIASITDGIRGAVDGMERGVEQVSGGVQLANKAGDAITEIRSGSREVVSVVHDITHALKEQATASHDVARNVERIAQMTERNSSQVRQTATAAHHLQITASALEKAVGTFKT